MSNNFNDNLYEINPPINHLISNVDKQISHLITQSQPTPPPTNKEGIVIE